MRGPWVAFIVAALFSACQAKPVLVKPPLEKEGELVIYLQPLPQEAENLTFTLEGISAVKEEGGSFPLSLSITELGGGNSRRQRFLASADLPPGEYAGLSFKVKSAFLVGEEGKAFLLVPEEGITITFPFRITNRKAFLLSMELNYRKAVGDGYRFFPAFSIFVPDRPPVGVVGYAANYGSNNVTVFDKERKQVVGVIATGSGPRGIALDQLSRRAYVCLAGDDTIVVIDVEAGDIINQVRLQTGDRPQEPALTPDGSLLFTANAGSDTVSVVDSLTLVEVERIPVGVGPHSILLDRAGRRAYVFNARSSTISVIDVAARSVAATISTVSAPLRGQFDRSEDRLFVIHEESPYITVFDPSSLSVQQRIFVGTGMISVKEDTNTDLLYLGRKPDTVEVFDTFSLVPLGYLPTGGSVSHMTIDGDHNTLYLVIPDGKTLKGINLISRETVFEIDVGEETYWVTLMGER